MVGPGELAGSREPLACILSDCDGVIVDSEAVAEAAMVEVLQHAFGTPDLAVHLRPLVGTRVIDIIRILESKLGKPQPDGRRAELQEIIDARVAEVGKPIPLALETYRAIGLPVAVVSNSAFPRLYRSVELAGMLPLVGRHIYSTEDVGRPKPEPDGYLYAARQLGFAPSACLVIEDSATGVQAACAAGMRVLGFLGGSHVTEGHAALLMKAGVVQVFDRMSDLPALVQHLNRRVE